MSSAPKSIIQPLVIKIGDLYSFPHLKTNPESKVSLRELKIRNGAWISRGQILGLIEETLRKENGEEETTLVKLKAVNTGKVVEIVTKRHIEVNPDTILCKISTECSHPTVMKDMCAECGADLRAEGEDNSVSSSRSYSAMVHSIPELRVDAREAQTLGKEDEDRLRKHKKLVLLVDLDQTLIHTTNDDIPPNLKNIYHFQLYGPRSPWYHTRIRPHTQDFLEKISKMYELHICTFGARRYAHEIASLLDPEGKYFSHRILSRDECFDSRSKTANLSSLFPLGDHMVCIIDDREDVWKFAPNLVHVKPYIFFKNTGDINAPPGAKDQSETKNSSKEEETETKSSKPSEEKKNLNNDSLQQVSDDLDITDDEDDTNDETYKTVKNNEDAADKAESKKERKDGDTSSSSSSSEGENENENDDKEEKKDGGVEDDLIDVEENDDYLLYLEEILRTVHTAYYDLYKQTEAVGQEPPDLKNVIPYVRRKTLQGINVVFSGVIPKHVPLEKSRAYMVARSLGAKVQEHISKNSKDRTTHLIAALVGTAKVTEAKKMGSVHIVTPDWLWACAERWEKVDEKLCANFELPNSDHPLPESMNPKFAFSADELEGMDKEINDVLSEDNSSSSSSDEDDTEKNKKQKRKVVEMDNESSSEDSLTGNEPKGWAKAGKRQKLEDEDEEDEDHDDDDDDDLATMAKDLEDYMGEEDSNLD